MQINCHALVRRVVVHVAHRHDLDSGIFIHQLDGVLVDDLRSTASQVAAFASDSGRKVRHKEREHLALDFTADHQDVTGAEILLRILVHVELDVLAVEIIRNRLALNQFELFRPVKQGHVHASSVRAVIVHNLIIGVGNLLLADKVLKHVTVLHLAEAEDRVVSLVLFRHGLDDGRDVVEFAVVAGVSPTVGSIGEIFIVILALVVVGVEEVLDIVEAYDIASCALAIFGARRGGDDEEQKSRVK